MRKPILFLLAALVLTLTSWAQTTYYAQTTTNLHLAANWNTQPNGTGTAAPNFTNALDIFQIDDEVGTVTIGANWAVSGNVQVGIGTNAVNLSTNGFTITGTYSVGNTATLSVNTNSAFTIGTLATGSTVSYNGDLAQSVRAGVYHNLTLTNATVARTKTASGAITVNGNLTVDNLNTLAMTTFLLDGTLSTIAGTGTISTTNTSSLPIPSGKVWTQTVNYAAATSGVAGGTYENLTITTAGTKTAQGNIIVNTVLNSTGTATTILAMSTFTLSGAFTNTGIGTVSTANTSGTPFPSGVTWTQTVSYLAGTTVVRAGTYQILSVTGAGTRTTDGDITVNGTLTVTTGTLNLGTNLLLGAFTPSSTGTIQTANTSATPIPVGKTWTQTLAYNSSSSQTVVYGTYAALNTTGGDRVFSSADSIRITGTFTTGSGALDFTGTSIALRGGTQTITITGQTAITFNNLSVSVTGTKTFSSTAATITVNGVLNIPSSTFVLALATNKLVLGIGATLSGAGAITTTCVLTDPLPAGVVWPYSVTYSATASNFVASGTYLNLSISGGGTATASGDITITNNLAVSGAFALSTFRLISVGGTITNSSTISTSYTGGVDPFPSAKSWPGTVSYAAAGNQTIVDGTYTSLSLSGGSNAVKTAAANLSVSGTLTVATSTILDMGTFTLTAITYANSGTIRTQNTSATPFQVGANIAGTGTVEYNSTSPQTVVNGTYTNLNLTGGNRTLSSTDTVRVAGTLTMGSGAITVTGSTVALNGATTQSIVLNAAGSTFNNFAIILGTTKTISGGNLNVDNELSILSTATLAMSTFDLGGTLASLTGTGIISTASTSANPIPSSRTWPYTVNFSSAVANQTIPIGTYQNLTASGAGSFVKNAAGDLTVTGVLNVAATTILGMTTFQLSGVTSTTGTGTLRTMNTTAAPIPVGKTWTFSVLYNGASSQNVVYGQYAALNLTGGNRVWSSTDSVKISGTFTSGTGTYTATGSTVVLNGTAAQTLTIALPGPVFNNLALTAGVGTEKTFTSLVATINIAGQLYIAPGCSLALGTNAISGVASNGGSGVLATQSTSVIPVPTGLTWSNRLLFRLTNGNQTIPVGTYNGGLSMSATSGARTRTLAGNITVDDTLSIGSSFVTMVLNGNVLTLNGIINPAQTGTITGSATSSIVVGSNSNDAGTLLLTQTSTATRSLNNLTLSRNTGADALILGNEVRLITALTITDGTLASNGNLVFISSGKTTSAQIAPVTGTGNVSGNVVIQRFMDGQPVATFVRWRFMASPVNTSNGIDDNWQKQMYITGPGTGGTLCPAITANSNGFDRTASNASSFFTRNAVTDAWDALPSTNATELQTGVGYRVFYRGSRSQNCDSIFKGTLDPIDTTLVATGTLAIGTQTLTGGSVANRYALVGNPFQATIDLESAGITLTNLSTTFSSFNPNSLNGSYGYYTIGGPGVNGMTQYISPGQAFWIQTVASSASNMSVQESAKVITQGGFGYFKTDGVEQDVLRVKLFKTGVTGYTDEVALAVRDNATWAYSALEDAQKISLATDQLQLAVPGATAKYAICKVDGFDATNNRINIEVKSVNNEEYTLDFSGMGDFTSTTTFTLHDDYLGTTQDLNAMSLYTFQTPDAASIATSRFYITMSSTTTPIPVKLTSFVAHVVSNDDVELVWQTASEQQNKKFVVERSVDGKSFEAVGEVAAAGNSRKPRNYTLTDADIKLSGTIYYRLKQVDFSGAFTYSNIVSVQLGQAKQTLAVSDIALYPVPADNTLMIAVKDATVLNNPEIKFYDMFGKEIVLPQTFEAGKWTVQTEELRSGIYLISITNHGETIQTRFVKR